MGFMKNQTFGSWESGNPSGQGVGTVEVNLLKSLMPKIMRVALQFQSGASSNRDREVVQGLQRDHDEFPLIVGFLVECRGGAPIDAVGRGTEPATAEVFCDERPRITTVLQPCRVHQQPFGQDLLKLVYLSFNTHTLG